MNILQAGMEKSGNYWLHKIIQRALTYSHLPTTTYIATQPIYPIAKTWTLSQRDQADVDVLDIVDEGCFYRISSIYRMPVLDLDEYLAHATHVWTHSEFCERCFTVFPKFDKIVYIVRDPRDVALSMARFQFTPYMQTYYPTRFQSQDEFLQATFRRYMLRWSTHVGGYLRHAEALNIHMVFYERLLHDFDREMTLLLAYLGLNATRDLLDAIKRDTDFEVMRSQNPLHVSKGTANQWVSQLSDAQKALAVQHAGRLMRLLNYPTDDTQTALPEIPAHLTPAMLDAALMPPVTVRQRLKKLVKQVVR